MLYRPRIGVSGDFLKLLHQNKAEILSYLRSGERPSEADESVLLAWATGLSEQELVLDEPVNFVEAPLRSVATSKASWYAAHYLKTISYSRLQQQSGGWHLWTPEWWKEREQEALGALAALKQALETQQHTDE